MPYVIKLQWNANLENLWSCQAGFLVSLICRDNHEINLKGRYCCISKYSPSPVRVRKSLVLCKEMMPRDSLNVVVILAPTGKCAARRTPKTPKKMLKFRPWRQGTWKDWKFHHRPLYAKGARVNRCGTHELSLRCVCVLPATALSGLGLTWTSPGHHIPSLLCRTMWVFPAICFPVSLLHTRFERCWKVRKFEARRWICEGLKARYKHKKKALHALVPEAYLTNLVWPEEHNRQMASICVTVSFMDWKSNRQTMKNPGQGYWHFFPVHGGGGGGVYFTSLFLKSSCDHRTYHFLSTQSMLAMAELKKMTKDTTICKQGRSVKIRLFQGHRGLVKQSCYRKTP